MSISTSNQVLHPTNPTLLKDVNVPKEKGQIRILENGSLLYREPITEEEGERRDHLPRCRTDIADSAAVPAVRLEDIRSRLVKEESKKLSYSQSSIPFKVQRALTDKHRIPQEAWV